MPSANTSYDALTGALTLSPMGTTAYSIKATSAPGAPCPLNESKVINVTVKPFPKASFDWLQPSNAADMSTNNTSVNADSFRWYFQNALLSTQKNVLFTLNETGLSCLTLYAINGCGIDSVTRCYDPVHAYLPNVFSPNADNLNDIFKLIYKGSINLIDFSIYDRWGERVFQTKDPATGWDGKFKGKDCEIGTYFYLAQIKREGAENLLLKGDVTLTR